MLSCLRWAIVGLLTASLAAETCVAETPGPAGAENPVERFRVDDPSNALLLPVELNGKTYPFLLDTGTIWTMYDTSLRKELGESRGRSRGQSASGKFTVELFDAPPARLGGLRFRPNTPIAAIDFDAFRKALGREFYGIIGMDFLRQYVVRIDFDRKEVAFLRSPGDSPGRRFDLDLSSGFPYLEASLPGVGRQSFRVDTGCGGNGGSGTLSTRAFDTALKAGCITGVGRVRALEASGEVLSRDGRLRRFAVGDFRHENLLMEESGEENLLGLTYLARYTVTLDFPHKALYLREGKRYADPDRRNLSGIRVLRSDGRTAVESVDEGSPAAAAGVKTGDVITRVGDKPASELSLHAIKDAFSDAGITLPVTVQRGGRTLTFPLRLVEWQTSAGAKEGRPASAR